MGMLGLRLQYHQIKHVYDTDANIRNLRAQEGHGSERLKGRHIAGTGHDHVGITDIVAGPSPNTRADGAVVNGRINVEPLPLRLFAGAGTLDQWVKRSSQPPLRTTTSSNTMSRA